jgi:hypothetical protein
MQQELSYDDAPGWEPTGIRAEFLSRAACYVRHPR